jgi:hypothetical protein
LRKLLNMLVIAVWVLAQTMTAANSSTHRTAGHAPSGHPAHYTATAHSMHSDASAAAGATAGHEMTGHDVHCPASDHGKPPAGTADGNCCDQANCHVADFVVANASVEARHIETFGIDGQRSLVVWAPPSPLPPPNSHL